MRIIRVTGCRFQLLADFVACMDSVINTLQEHGITNGDILALLSKYQKKWNYADEDFTSIYFIKVEHTFEKIPKTTCNLPQFMLK